MLKSKMWRACEYWIQLVNCLVYWNTLTRTWQHQIPSWCTQWIVFVYTVSNKYRKQLCVNRDLFIKIRIDVTKYCLDNELALPFISRERQSIDQITANKQLFQSAREIANGQTDRRPQPSKTLFLHIVSVWFNICVRFRRNPSMASRVTERKGNC